MPKQKQTNPKADSLHRPVMVQEVLSFLSPQGGESYLDLTAGYGGHARAVVALTGSPEKTVLVDRDITAVNALRELFKKAGAKIVHRDFWSACQELAAEDRRFDMILADLGISSPHVGEPGRGFSFARSGPLDMRMDQRQPLSADYFVNRAPQAELERIISRYGEEPRAGRIARAVTAARPIASTGELATLIANAAGWRARRGKIHPATRSFQAIRIAVNDELRQLEESLPLMKKLLAPSGRLVVISFHSLEDRLVKRYLQEHAGMTYDAELKLLTKKAVKASQDEIVSNPRARSAKLRAAAKIKTER